MYSTAARASSREWPWLPICVDRKSTRLNSSHGYISYAVFCLKKQSEHAGPPSHLLRQLGIREQAADAVGVRGWIVAIDEVAADLVAHHRPQPWHARRHHETTSRLGLETDEPERLGVRRHDTDIGCRIEVR